MNNSETNFIAPDKSFQQRLENLPDEILKQKRFFEVGADKVPRLKGWSNPDNQKFYTEIEGYKGFDTTGHDRAVDYLFLDFDHIFNDKGEFVNAKAEKCFNYVVNALKTYCELSVSVTGAHVIAVPTAGIFKTIASGKNGKIDLGDGAYLEIFYKTGGRYCFFTGNVYRCEPKAPVAHGQAVDDVFKKLLDEVARQNQKPPAPARSQGQSTELIYSSADARKENSSKLGIEYDLFRAQIMLDAINPTALDDSDWLAVISSCKNIGVPYPVVDAFNRRDSDRYDEKENQTRWNSITDPSFDIETLHGIAKRFGYQEKSARLEWYKLHPELMTEIIHRPAQASDDNAPPMDDNGQEKISWTQDKIKSCPVNLRLSKSYDFSQRGIYLIVPPKKAGDASKKICAARTPIVPTKIFRAPRSNNYTYEVAILIRGKWNTTEIEGTALADTRKIITLAGCGALIDEPKILCRFLNATIALNPDLQEIKAYASTGWTDDTFTTFAYPHNGDCIVRRAGFDYDRDLATRGDAQEWKQKFLEVINKGGAVACAYIGTALASILARPLNIINPQVHLLGTSGGGKTALQKFAASIFGNPRKLLRTFAATNKNRQLVAAAFCDLPSFYDELETIQGKAAEEALSTDVYNFAEGKGNQANKRDGTARETFEFGGARLTTGERPILKQHDQRGAYKRLIQFDIHGKLFDDEFAADLHIFSESNFGHFALQWIQFAQEHMQEIQKAYQHWAKSNPTTRNYEPTHLKTLSASLVAVEFFKVMLGVTAQCDDVALVRNRRFILDNQLPTIAQMDDTTRAIKDLNSYVAAHEKSFARDEKDNETGKPVEIGSWGPVCPGKIFDTGAVVFHPTELKRILEDELHYASAEKLINDWNAQGNILITNKGRTTHLIRIGNKTYRTIHFKANIISTDIDSAEEAYYDELLEGT